MTGTLTNGDSTATTLDGGTLRTAGKNIFTTSSDEPSTAEDYSVASDKITFTEGVVEITDEIGSYKLESLAALQKKLNAEGKTDVQLSFINGKLADASDTWLQDIVDASANVAAETIKAAVAEDKSVTITGSGEGTVAAVVAEGATSINLSTTESGSSTNPVAVGLILAGTGAGEDLIQKADSTLTITVGANTGLGLGQSADSAGHLNADVVVEDGGYFVADQGTFTAQNVTLEEGATMNVNAGSLAVNTIDGEGDVTVGTDSTSAKLTVNKLATTGTVFLDPAWVEGATIDNAAIANANQVAFNELAETGLVTDLVVGRNSAASLGSSDMTAALAAWKESGLLWGDVSVNAEAVGAMAYVENQIVLAGGYLAVDGSLVNDGSTLHYVANSVNVGADGLLIINSANFDEDTAVFKLGDDQMAGSSSIVGLVYLANAYDGKVLKLTDGLTINDLADDNILMANKLLSAVYADGTITVGVEQDAVEAVSEGVQGGTALVNAALKDAGGAAYLETVYGSGFEGTDPAMFAAAARSVNVTSQVAAATGAQRMAVLAAEDAVNAVYDAMKFEEPGIHGWATITGSKMTADDLKAGAGSYGIKTELGGVAIGGTYAQDSWQAGASLQVGKGTGRSSGGLAGAKAEADFYGLSVYGSKTFSCGGRLLGTLGWMQSQNDYSFEGRKAEGDVNTYYAGIRAEHAFKDNGAAVITPYIGLTYMHVEADAVNMGLANHKTKQDVVEMPIGAKLALDLAPVAGWTIAPSLDINVVPTFGDRDVTTTNYGVDVTTDVLNRGLFNTRLGVTGTNGAWGFNADIGFSAGSADTEGVFARVGVNYAF